MQLKMNKNKRGLAAGQLVVIILVLVAFVLIAGSVSRFIAKAQPKEAEILCQNSINMRAMSTVNIGSADVRLVPPMCKTIDVEVTGNREEIKDQLAYLMARCWWMFGEGRYEELLDSETFSRALGIPKGGNDCFLCYTAVIDQKNIEEGDIPAQEMYNYLIEKDHRQIKGTSYLDYIQSGGGPGLALVADGIAGRQSYGVVFMSKNKFEGGSNWLLVVAAAAAVVGAAVCGIATAGVCLVVGAVAVAGASVSVFNSAAYADLKAKLYGSERDVSVVTLDHLKGIEAGGCMVTDLAGE
jgi:hypothetical protein